MNGTRALPLTPSALADTPRLCARLAVVAVILSPVALLGGHPEAFVVQVVFSTSAVLVGRAMSYAAVREFRGRRRIARPTIAVGEGPLTTRTVELLAEHPSSGLLVNETRPKLPASIEPLTAVLVVEIADLNGRILRSLTEAGVVVYLGEQAAGAIPRSRRDRAEALDGQVFVRMAPSPTRRPGWRAKRAFDVTAALAGVLILSPILAFGAVGTKLTSPGPVLFRQPRVGRGGRPFTMYKFRTYPIDHVDDKFSREHDECPIAFGRFLRRTSIDELPQLVNVIRGEMSIVGPRPERPHFAGPLSASVSDYELRHRVRGGITGAAQVKGFWGNSCIDTRVQLDNEYIDDWSFWSDFVILGHSASAVVRKAGT